MINEKNIGINDTIRTSKMNSNHKEWFHENRKTYEVARMIHLELMESLSARIQQFDKEIIGLNIKNCIFRINRDIRFSKDKSPYKTHFGGFIAKDGTKSQFAGYYLHIEPGASFLGGGVYMPAADKLKAIRQEIYYHADEFKQILSKENLLDYFGELEEVEKLKTAPKGFPKDFADIDLLRHKHYVVGRNLSDTEITADGFMEEALKGFKIMFPFNSFLNRGISMV